MGKDGSDDLRGSWIVAVGENIHYLPVVPVDADFGERLGEGFIRNGRQAGLAAPSVYVSQSAAHVAGKGSYGDFHGFPVWALVDEITFSE